MNLMELEVFRVLTGIHVNPQFTEVYSLADQYLWQNDCWCLLDSSSSGFSDAGPSAVTGCSPHSDLSRGVLSQGLEDVNSFSCPFAEAQETQTHGFDSSVRKIPQISKW